MLIDGGLGFDTEKMGERARQVERDGYDGAWSAETGHDPLLILAAAAPHTERLELGTGIVVAFGRSPMITATMANDVQLLSKGRLMLGLGSQIKPHIEKRYSMPWSHPAARMREYILAMRAIWDCWNDRTKLEFRGEFYTHTLMTPFFDPGPNPYGQPRVFLAAVGGLMTEVAGEVADGMLVHGFTTERYFREVTMPALDRGLAKAGRSRQSFQVSYPGFVITGNKAEQETATKGVKAQIAFYGSTPAYRPVLELHGWGELQTELNGLSKRGEWGKMADLITDDIVDAFAVRAEPDKVAGKVLERFGDVVDRFSFYAPYQLEHDKWSEVLAGFRQ
ncbi:MAG TPA: LLM class F420-dependent oxidoreductase [Acidimicrobiales bacterium]|jgi:probable F420-dependent oxidoreductase|nr:LLM class F420-dependent oxidoreductase [Acidimicrobiales bacterium]